jgi:hypothetical protein
MDNPEFREPKGRITMTEQNQNTADDTQGHMHRDDMHRDDTKSQFRRDDDTDDDTEGHVNYRGSGDQPKVDDAEGHLFRRGDDEDDTEGHLRTR